MEDKRVGILHITAGALMQALGLPPEMTMYGIRVVPDTIGSIELKLEGPQFRLVSEGSHILRYALEEILEG